MHAWTHRSASKALPKNSDASDAGAKYRLKVDEGKVLTVHQRAPSDIVYLVKDLVIGDSLSSKTISCCESRSSA